MRGKAAKLPSKEHPLELLETVHAIADHSLLQISRRKRGEAYFKRFKVSVSENFSTLLDFVFLGFLA